MIQIFKMAFRELGRNRRRSFFSALALAIVLALLLLMAGVIAGELRQSMDASIKLQSGHLQVRAKTYDENKTSLAWEDLVDNPSQAVAQIASLALVKVATPRLYASGIVATGDNSLGVRVIGIDPPSPANAPFQNGMLSGEFLKTDDSQGILVGKLLADKLGLDTGDRVNLLVNTSNGGVDQQPFFIRGIYTTHIPGFDQGTIFMPLVKAQAITQTQNHATLVFILLKDRDQTGVVARALTSSQYQVVTWEQTNTLLLQFNQFSRDYMVLIYLIFLGIAATVIINTLIMSVFERTREIGILTAIGMRSSSIMGMFFAESSLLAVGGILMGLVLGAIGISLFNINGFSVANFGVTGIALGDQIFAYVVPGDVIMLTLLAFVITLLAGLYPAILAARMEPVEALRGGKK